MSVFFLLLLFLYLSFGFRALCKYSEDAHNQDSRIARYLAYEHTKVKCCAHTVRSGPYNRKNKYETVHDE